MHLFSVPWDICQSSVRYKGRGSHSISNIKKIFNSSELGLLSTMVNSNLGSVDTGAGVAVREEQKHDFDKNQDSGPGY